METAIKCVNILSTTVIVVASIYVITAFPWIASGSIDVAIGIAVVLNATTEAK